MKKLIIIFIAFVLITAGLTLKVFVDTKSKAEKGVIHYVERINTGKVQTYLKANQPGYPKYTYTYKGFSWKHNDKLFAFIYSVHPASKDLKPINKKLFIDCSYTVEAEIKRILGIKEKREPKKWLRPH